MVVTPGFIRRAKAHPRLSSHFQKEENSPYIMLWLRRALVTSTCGITCHCRSARCRTEIALPMSYAVVYWPIHMSMAQSTSLRARQRQRHIDNIFASAMP